MIRWIRPDSGRIEQTKSLGQDAPDVGHEPNVWLDVKQSSAPCSQILKLAVLPASLQASKNLQTSNREKQRYLLASLWTFRIFFNFLGSREGRGESGATGRGGGSSFFNAYPTRRGGGSPGGEGAGGCLRGISGVGLDVFFGAEIPTKFETVLIFSVSVLVCLVQFSNCSPFY